MKRIRPGPINTAQNGVITFAFLGKQVPVSLYSFAGLPFFRFFAKIVENLIVILFAILGNNLVIHRIMKNRTFAISQSCAASFKAKMRKTNIG
ncbi:MULTISPECIES: hypothetical protein [Bacteroides]|jgi:hypothetical protein|uniref:Uncharacterized protein n=1 Tax=Bacteroides caecimuris TaxID=1796613 RepID=A0A1C7H308_9BACE|nr:MULTISPECIES: hypothetical protein [Bacteroides]ANU58172.1 hypothetical protein A4V03_11845 [Bacteroides caecimuris]OXE60981.1 hypothetical protein ADH74_19555 [Bacteroides caecimuris]QQR16886.1 hypothetical protein I5Q79_17020 [Bacteroides caecimuris]UQA29872.1 hypothetical protein M2854_17150 [Bacteroides caecimuris]